MHRIGLAAPCGQAYLAPEVKENSSYSEKCAAWTASEGLALSKIN